MDITTFIKNISLQFEETDPELITAETNFKDLEEWGSLTALSIIAMADEEYDVMLTGKDIQSCNKVADLYDIIKSRAN